MSTATESLPTQRSLSIARLPAWWPVAALTLLAAVLRLSTLGLQSFWYDEAFTPLHVLHPSLFDTMEWVGRTENSPPLWYLIEWFDYRIFGTGEYALRLPSALSGIALVPVAFAIGRELAGRASGLAFAAVVTVSPMFVWYSQEARSYGLFTFTAGLTMLAFLRVLREPTGRRFAVFAVCGALALLSHYFAVFLLIGMGLWLLADPRLRRASLPPLAALVTVALALVPLILAQGGRNTKWIGNQPLKQRLQQALDYYLTGFSGGRLGHSVEVLVGLPLLAAAALGAYGAWSYRRAAPAGKGEPGDPRERSLRGLWIALAIAAAGALIPLVLVLFGLDYFAPRNLIGTMLAFTGVLAVLGTWPARRRACAALLAVGVLALLAVTVAVDFDAKLQRSEWRQVSEHLPAGRARAITVNTLGTSPLRYYLPGTVQVPKGEAVLVSEVVEAGEEPVRPSRIAPPARGFRLVERLDYHGLVVFRFVSPTPRRISYETLRRRVISEEHGTVLASGNARTAR